MLEVVDDLLGELLAFILSFGLAVGFHHVFWEDEAADSVGQVLHKFDSAFVRISKAHLEEQGFECLEGELEHLIGEEQVFVHWNLLELVVLLLYENFVFGRVELPDVSQQVLVDALVPGTCLDTGHFGSTKGLHLGLILDVGLNLIFCNLCRNIFFKSDGVVIQYEL